MSLRVDSEVSNIFSQVVRAVRLATGRKDFTKKTLERSQAAPGIIRGGMSKEDSKALESLGFTKECTHEVPYRSLSTSVNASKSYRKHM